MFCFLAFIVCFFPVWPNLKLAVDSCCNLSFFVSFNAFFESLFHTVAFQEVVIIFSWRVLMISLFGCSIPSIISLLHLYFSRPPFHCNILAVNHYIPSDFFRQALYDGFHRSLSDNKASRVSGILHDILADLTNSVVWMVIIPPWFPSLPAFFRSLSGSFQDCQLRLVSPSPPRSRAFLVLCQGLCSFLSFHFYWFSVWGSLGWLSPLYKNSSILLIIAGSGLLARTREFYYYYYYYYYYYW